MLGGYFIFKEGFYTLAHLIHNVHLFCEVVDNFGDIGVCWRMARQMADEYEFKVTLWVDDLVSFQKICPQVDAVLNQQEVARVDIRHWTDAAFTHVLPAQTGDVVIEGFGCTLPVTYVEAMAKRAIAPVWLNVEYLSAEDWVEGCHTMVSVHPSLPLKKYFFFPGFTEKTGGVLMDKKTLAAKADFDQHPEQRWTYLENRHVPVIKDALYMSLFCYPHAPVVKLLEQLQATQRPIVVVIPENTAVNALTTFCGQPLSAGETFVRDHLTICCIPFSDQSGYDYLLWSCDINFVRGEDSFVRAQWAGRPFVWHIYPQEEKVHMIKLNAFLDHYLNKMPVQLQSEVKQLWYSWNNEPDNLISEQQVNRLLNNLANWQQYSADWQKKLLKNGDLVTNIICFCRNKLK